MFGVGNNNNNTAQKCKEMGVEYGGRFPANLILTYEQMTFDEVCGGFPSNKNITKTHIAKNSDNNVNFNASKEVNVIGYMDSGSASRYFYCAKASKKDRDEGLDQFEVKKVNDGRKKDIDNAFQRGTTLRHNTHPTVKPTELMQYLVRLVTPDNGIILDCFMGSGSTGKAVMYENLERNKNYSFVGIERESEYYNIAKARIEYVEGKINK
jgi:site-specific DNA-methyltransferase (adenine-specific)